MSTIKLNPSLSQQLHQKACQSDCRYKISAFAFDKRGDLIGTARNTHRNDFPAGGKGKSMHAERVLINRYGDLIKTILICRVGRQGDLLPISACPACSDTAEKLGIKIISIKE